jgi:hypothetical protein
MRDFEHEEAPFRSCHINPPDHSFGSALSWTGWMEVDTNLVPNCNLHRQCLRRSEQILRIVADAETPTWQLVCG